VWLEPRLARALVKTTKSSGLARAPFLGARSTTTCFGFSFSQRLFIYIWWGGGATQREKESGRRKEYCVKQDIVMKNYVWVDGKQLCNYTLCRWFTHLWQLLSNVSSLSRYAALVTGLPFDIRQRSREASLLHSNYSIIALHRVSHEWFIYTFFP
jgi:hypothetical protein